MHDQSAAAGSYLLKLFKYYKYFVEIVLKLIAMAGFSLDDTTFGEDENEENAHQDWDSIIFLIDASKQMHANNHVKECLETYKNIVRQKCATNKKDKIGLLLLGVEDSNCGINNVLVLQEFNAVNVDSLKNIKNIIKNDMEKYKQKSSAKYSLYDVLTYVSQTLHTSQKNLNSNNIIVLCTDNDDPYSNNPSEKQRVKHLVSTFRDINVEFRVVGLSQTWNDDCYKELQIVSGTFVTNNYKRIFLKDFEQSIVHPARAVGKVPWRIAPNLCVEVAIINIVSMPKYPTKVKLEKERNEILQSHLILQEDGSQSHNLRDTPDENKRIITNDRIVYYQNYGGMNIYFEPSEQKAFKNLGLEPTIEILAFKPIVIDPQYFIDAAYLVVNTASNHYDSKLFFTSFISKCAQKEVMPICKVITKYNVFLCMMIPSEEDHGFYMLKIPFADGIRDLEKKLVHYIFSNERMCPVSEEAVSHMKKMMGLSKMDLDIRLFKNPKLEKCIAHIEALALDEKLDSLPPDSTLPPPLKDDVENLLFEIKRLTNLSVPESTSKRPRPQKTYDSKRSKIDVQTLAENKKLPELTQVEMKSFLVSVNLPSYGSKATLIERINKYFNL